MKKTLGSALCLILIICSVANAKPPKGGAAPCLATCCLGPRVGLEMNEGTKVSNDEWFGVLTSLLLGINTNTYMSSYKAFTGESMNELKESENLGGPTINATVPQDTGGFTPCIASFCLGPRIGLELNDGRAIRSREYLYFIPLVNIVPALIECSEAYSGKTMSELAAEEGLDKKE